MALAGAATFAAHKSRLVPEHQATPRLRERSLGRQSGIKTVFSYRPPDNPGNVNG